MNPIAFLNLTTYNQENDGHHDNKKKTIGFSILQQTFFGGLFEPINLDSELNYGVFLSELPEATQSGNFREVKYAIGFETESLLNFSGFKTHTINFRQRSLPLNLTSDAVTETHIQIHWNYLSSMWTLPTTEDGELLEAKAKLVEIPCDGYRWPSELGTMYLIVQNMHEVETLLSNIQFMIDKELIDPWYFQVEVINAESFTIQPPQNYFGKRVRAAHKYVIDDEFCRSSDLVEDDDERLLNDLDLSIEATLKAHAVNNSHFEHYEDYEDFQRTQLWLTDNRHPLTRALYRNGLIKITDQGRYLYSVEEINFYKVSDTDDVYAEHVIHQKFALMEELADRLRSKGIPCDYIHYHSDESPDGRHLSRSDHAFMPISP
ncbi:DUF4427 domain-containing protein [Pseudomonas putida]|uniref:DUF4427 domain-containing protein n=1 Tax=Pseudomonas putida TaxID=303 RepID=UPI0015756F5E|nr:DUF4427 domain-containing protein [Pseudomonas putida]NTY90340.1 DUF4427 domain-containing protein [Pseudomonas putida]NTY98882.1 DUF4427 domain-containing protein [Pseudomonas putida]NTZ21165.1 DUF4427 domain-containing protein [Pseudomonas putida]NTZ53316.1 DUF4427 domain-containing protein [Pseudomonas putida]NTZ65034.1 DUF4427 domain-containing protein [Pseudomonas putida]